jgi:hypothetical protein
LTARKAERELRVLVEDPPKNPGGLNRLKSHLRLSCAAATEDRQWLDIKPT